MTDWFAFIITLGEETFQWLGSMRIMDVPVAGILVGFVILGVLFRILYRP